MRNSTFKPKPKPRREAKQIEYVARPRAPACAIEGLVAKMSVPVPKPESLQHQGYINLVRGMACIRCKKPPRSQFCHSDEGKGTGTKSDCRLGWPGCADCHFAIGTARIYTKAVRRELEAEYARRTRAAIREAGLWPKRLPPWLGDE